MAIKSILKMGNKKLGIKSLPVMNFFDGEIKELVNDMQDTMQAKGGVGIAAPQIGSNLRVIIFGFEHNERYPDEKPVPFTVLINPNVEPLLTETEDGWEGCLSIPGMRGLVPRYKKIKYTGYDIEGNFISRIVHGFHARVVQHECDHIDGVLFPERIKDLKYFGFENEFADLS